MEREERRRAAWEVERDIDTLPYRKQIMPWARGFEEDWRFRKSLAASISICIAVGLMATMVALPITERTVTEEIPERVAKLVRELRPSPPPPPPVAPEPVMAEEDPIEPEPEPEQVVEETPEITPESTEEQVIADTAEPDPKEEV